MDNDDPEKEPLIAEADGNRIEPKTTTPRRRFRRVRSSLAGHTFQLSSSSSDPASAPQFPLHPTLGQVLLLLSIYLGVGTLCFCMGSDQLKGVRTIGLLDAVYFCVQTMTTVGYGDLIPNSVVAKLLACAFVFVGVALVGLVLSKAADYLVEKQEDLLIRALHMRRMVGEMREIEASKVKYKLVMSSVLLVILMAMGVAFLSLVEELSLVDSFYCVCSTVTTLGYGDKSFSTVWGRVFATFWMLSSTICLAQVFLYAAEFSTERRQHALARMVLHRRMTYVDLEAADLDDDGVVGAAEFIIYKLKEMGKITEEDIAVVLNEFEALNVDRSGTLTLCDLMLAQSES